MKVILRKDHESLGSTGDIVNVKPGYARNFLIPKGVAMELTKGNLKVLEMEKERLDMQKRREERQAQSLKEEIEKISVTATVTVGEDDRIFGTVTTQNIADLLKDKGFTVDKKQITIEEQVKALGIYPVRIKLFQDIFADIKLWVVKDNQAEKAE